MISPDLLGFLTRVMERLHRDHHDNDPDKTKLLHLAKLTEEVGELAEQVLGSCYAQQAREERTKEFTSENIAKEGADVLITTIILLLSQGVDINKLLENRTKEIGKRLGIPML